MRPDDNSEPVPVFSRRVRHDWDVTDWEFVGFFKSPSALSEWFEEKLEPAPFLEVRAHRLPWQTVGEPCFQFLFVYDWTADMLTRNHHPYTIEV